MCGGAKYVSSAGKEWKIYFPSPKAALPVLKKDGGGDWVKWGMLKEEEFQFFPNGGWARLGSIKLGKWERYHPKPIVIPVQSFMEKDNERVSHWFDLTSDQALQGLVTIHDDETRVYVVTTDTPAVYNYIHDRWPRIIERDEEALHG